MVWVVVRKAGIMVDFHVVEHGRGVTWVITAKKRVHIAGLARSFRFWHDIHDVQVGSIVPQLRNKLYNCPL